MASSRESHAVKRCFLSGKCQIITKNIRKKIDVKRLNGSQEIEEHAKVIIHKNGRNDEYQNIFNPFGQPE